MPDSLKWIAALLACALLAAPISLAVQRIQTVRQARADGAALTGGDPQAGRAAIGRYGCGGCHEIGGVSGASGQVGPSLKNIAKRTELAGRLSNDPSQLIRWIRHPQQIEPGGGMPDLKVSETDGRDIAAYLYSAK